MDREGASHLEMKYSVHPTKYVCLYLAGNIALALSLVRQ